MSQEQEVVLHVYDLSQGLAAAISKPMLGLCVLPINLTFVGTIQILKEPRRVNNLSGQKIDGVWHTGVYAFGREYYFGPTGSSGIKNPTPGEFQALAGFGPTRTIVLGTTTKTREEFEQYLRSIKPNWTCDSYSLFTHNCNNFSDAVSQYLVGKRIPSYITSVQCIVP